MTTLLTIIIIIASALLILVVFVQNPKGGGLSSDFGAATQLGGVQKTDEFIDKATWSLAGVIAILSISLTIYLKSPERIIKEAPVETEQPANDGQPASDNPVGG